MSTLSGHAGNSTAVRSPAPVIRQLTPDQWQELKQIRLSALADAPQMFLSSFEVEKDYEDAQWELEFKRGDWYAGYVDGEPACMMGVTKEADAPVDECYIEYMWVLPRLRRYGVASLLLDEVLGNLRVAGCATVFLWVLTGNDAAARLYRGMGFDWTGVSQPLADRPGSFERQMNLSL
jgi:ribosomal protein S18 acetylase RimI-like enzyme